MINREILRKKTVQVLYAGFIKKEINPVEIQKELKTSVERTYYLYNHLLQLMIEIWRYGLSRHEVLTNRFIKGSGMEKPADIRFLGNRFIIRLSENESLQKNIEEGKISWTEQTKTIKALYDNILSSDYYQKYIAEESLDFEKERNFWIDVFKKEICKKSSMSETGEYSINIDSESKESFIIEEAMADALKDNINTESCDIRYVLEDENIYWNDDLDFVSGFVLKTMKSIKEQGDDDKVLPMFRKDNIEGMRFAFNIADYAIINNDQLNSTIERYLRNWDINRIQIMDLTIMKAAITELLVIPMVPVSVTLNEYIEIAKLYSSPKSVGFINGVLNRFVEDNEGKLTLKLIPKRN